MKVLSVKIEKIGLKDATQYIEPYITVSVRGECYKEVICLFQIYHNVAEIYLKQQNELSLNISIDKRKKMIQI